MEGGQKVLARNLLEKTLENVKRAQLERYHKAPPEEKENIEINPRAVLHNAVENCKPLLKLVPIKRGGVTYKVTQLSNVALKSQNLFTYLLFNVFVQGPSTHD